MNSGIYCIENKINGNRYIGSSCDLYKRTHRHIRELRNNDHCNIRLQRAFNKYGENSFEFLTLLECDKSELLKAEQYFIDKIKPEYNILQKAGSPIGYRHTQGSKEKIRLSSIGRIKPSKTYIGFISPDGVEYRNIEDLKRFCQQHNLNYVNMNQVDNGHKRTHKGWRRLDECTSEASGNKYNRLCYILQPRA